VVQSPEFPSFHGEQIRGDIMVIPTEVDMDEYG
jgi:hypothetical protein